MLKISSENRLPFNPSPVASILMASTTALLFFKKITQILQNFRKESIQLSVERKTKKTKALSLSEFLILFHDSFPKIFPPSNIIQSLILRLSLPKIRCFTG